MTAAGLAWRLAATALAPLLPLWLARRARRGKEIPARLAERRGEGAVRPPGPLLWLHAASVGETTSILPLLEALAARRPDLSLLVTTGTVTAAAVLGQRLPPALAARVTHRFVPLDVPGWAARFLDGWRPDAAVFVESELWPNLLAACRRRGVPLALVNARMSARAARRWLRAPGFAREVLASFRLVLAQSMADAERLEDLGAADVGAWGNLKFAAPPLPADAAELDRLRALLAGRPVLLAASTHPGEEAIAAEAHRRLAPAHPGLLLLVVPRHPPRGAEVAATLAAAGLRTTRRSLGQDPGPEDAAHVADTLGELGLFYRLAGVALVGGSLVPHGGQNPLEPARLGCPILLGPHTWNFAEPVLRLVAAGGAEIVAASGAEIVSAGGARVLPAGPNPAGALAEAAGAVLSDGTRARKMAAAAAAVADDASGLPDRIAAAVLDLLPPPAGAAGPGQASPVAAGSPGPVA